ncbi:MAG: class I SAM-dependent methyltransferase [Rhodobacteraceae bacterium]|nr:class I SAM-dependent methyltransferase [Paracoccaceae bacterium]
MHFKKRLLAAYRAFGDPGLVVDPTQMKRLVDARVGLHLSKQKMHETLRGAVEEGLAKMAPQLDNDLPGRLAALGEEWKSAPPRWDRVREVAHEALERAGLRGGRMLEIGGRLNPRHRDFPDFDYHALDLEKAPGAEGVKVMAGDITNCPQIPDGSFDFIFSFDVFEHIDRPWLAGQEICRLLRPGGVTVHSTLFAWRYHPCPIDYFRFTAPGLKSLFDLDCLYSDFDYSERRRDVRGQGRYALKPDLLGGWRENVRVHYAGVKR